MLPSRTFFTVIAFTIVALAVKAQPCTKEDLLKQLGYWTPGIGGSTSGISATDLARQKSIVNNIIQPIQKNYTPKGMDIIFGGAYMNQSRLPEHIKAGNYYYAYFYFIEHDCPYNKEKMKSKHFGGHLTVYANDFGLTFGHTFFMPEQPYEENLYADGFILLDQPPIKTDKGWYWKEGQGTYTTLDYRYVISRDDKTPFVHITKKEYANMVKEFCQKKIKAADIEYTRFLKSIEESYVQLKKFNEADANTVREQGKLQAERTKENAVAYYSRFIPLVDDFLKTAGELILNEPAILDHVKGINGFYGFVDANHQYAKWAVKPNPAYFDATLPKSTPQFFTVNFNIYETDGVNIHRAAMEDLLKIIDFNALRSLVGK